MHAETLALLTKPLHFHEVSKVVVMVTRYFFKNIFTNEKSPKNITFNNKIINFPTYIC
jgi:hypothetical protein